LYPVFIIAIFLLTFFFFFIRTNYWQTCCLVAEGLVLTYLGAFAKLWKGIISFVVSVCVGWNSIVVIATCYRLDGQGIESKWGQYICIHPDWPWAPPSLLGSGYRVFPGGKAAETWPWQSTSSSVVVKERVQLYIYPPTPPPSGPLCPVAEEILPLLLP